MTPKKVFIGLGIFIGLLAIGGVYLNLRSKIESANPVNNNFGVSTTTTPITDQSASSTTSVISRPNTTPCNGNSYPACPAGQNFICPPGGGAAYCQLPPPQKSNPPPIAISPPILVPTPSSSVVTNATATSSPENALPPETSIDPESIVGILCYYNTTLTDTLTGQTIPGYQEEVRGSGVIINSAGNILTNRHLVVRPEDTGTAIDTNGNPVPITIDYSLEHCEAGQLPAGTYLPTVAQIQSLNPYITIPVLGYTVRPVYISKTSGLSATEIERADFAILQITGLTKDGPIFGITSVPGSFPYAKLLGVKPYAQRINNEQVVTYGFPGDITEGQGNAFGTLTMTGGVGYVTKVDLGDTYYVDTPLIVETDLEIAHGRSGSPLLWRGYVIGLITYFTNGNRTESDSVASDAILKSLQFTGYIPGD